MLKAFTSLMEENTEEKKEYRWHVAISLFILFVSCSLANIPEHLDIFLKPGLAVAIAAHIAFDITFHVIGSPFR